MYILWILVNHSQVLYPACILKPIQETLVRYHFKAFFFIFNLCCLLVSPSVWALDFDPYLRVEASMVNVNVANVDFYPKLTKGALGVFLWQGVGLEAQGELMTQEDMDKDSDIYADTAGYESLVLRLQSPFDSGWAAYVTMGYARFDLQTYQKAPLLVSFEESLKSGIAGIGFEKQIGFYPRLSYALSYEHVFDDELVSVRAFNFSYRFAFGKQ